ncbi:lysylphosphatidylglycerol synthase transmembrane domain-containing protein [Thalassospiraceae bacterium LMO-JJ14]|nr:lysylphosphatidylglycerol synthase transmembrane domain-containing protein [Thalassospiraceae bacterium LMO-JJ14]
MTRKQFLIALKVVVSIGLMSVLISGIDLGAEKDRIISADIGLMLAAAFVLIFQMGIGGARWWAVMRAIEHPLPWLELTRLFWIGGFFSQALPSSVGGDPIRIYMAYKDGLPLGKSINGVMLERVVTIVGLVVLVTAVQPAFLPKLDDQAQMLTLWSLFLLGVGTIAGIIVLMCLDRLPAALTRFRVVRGLHELAGDTRKLFLHPGHVVAALFFGVMTHINISLCVFLLAQGLAVDVTWLDCIVLMPPVILVTTLPISIAGWGVREGAMTVAFALVGVSQGGAVVLSLSMGLLAIVITLPAGVVWLLGRKKGESISVAEAEAAVEEELEHAAESASEKS